MWIEIVIVIGLLIYHFWDNLFGSRPKGYPPGPIRFPIVGNLPQFGKDPLLALMEWKQKYGNVVGLRFGDFNVVLISEYDTIKEAYDNPEFSGRPNIGPFMLIGGPHNRGIVPSEGRPWAEQQRFALKHLREFGFGKKSMEGVMQEDATELIDSILADAGKSISTTQRLQMVVSKSLWNFLTGEKFALDDPKFQNIMECLQAAFSTTTISGPVFFMPWLADLIPNFCGWSTFKEGVLKVQALIGSVIESHKKSFDSDHLNDFMDLYLNEIKNTTDPESTFYKSIGDENLLATVLNIFGAGAEAASATLNWAFYYLARDLSIQRKFQMEIDAVVGRSRLPSFNDQEKMVYTKALMTEVLRLSSVAPFGLFHKVTDNVIFQGYKIPKDTTIMANLFEAHHDKAVWGDAEVFRPERFLSADGKTIVKTGPVIPFSIGKRVCLGETLARNEFFLFLTSVLQRFELSFDPLHFPSSIEETPSLIRFAPNFQLFLKDRFVEDG